MVRNDLLSKRFLLNDVVDYDNFISTGEMYDLHWLDGHCLFGEIADFFRKKPFPFVLEVDENGYVSYDSHSVKSVPFKQLTCATPKEVEKEMPLTLLTNKKNPGITVTLPDGREFVYDLNEALSSPNHFHDWLKDISRPSIKVGDLVELVDAGQLYTTYLSWFKENNVDIDIAARYAYADEHSPSTKTYYYILATGKNNTGNTAMYAITQKNETIFGGNPVYLVGERGIKKVR